MEKLYIKNIVIENFKAIKKLKFHPQSNFNIIIGKNNIGKSTLFEAILLWEKCYNLLIQADNKHFYKVPENKSLSQYLTFQDLDFLRIINDADLFFTRNNTTKIIFTITNSIRDFELGVSISKPPTIKNSFFRIRILKQNEFKNFSDYCIEKNKKLNEMIFIYQTRPIANILQKESYLNMGQIKRKIEKGMSQEVLRNKIINKTQEEIEQLEKNISNIIEEEVRFSKVTSYQKKNDEYITLKVNEKDLHLQGSGLLQIIEIVSTINYIEAPLNILLVDEPDSHIHSNLQSKLMSYLKSIYNNQTFVITHNDAFVDEAVEGEVFYLNEQTKISGELKSLALNNFDLVKNELGGIIIGLTKINKAQKIIFVEGKDDIEYIKKLLEKYIQIKSIDFNINHIAFFHLRGKDFLEKKVENVKRVLSEIFKNKQFICIYDKDFSPMDNANKLNDSIKRKLGSDSQVIYHNGYCIESTLFSDIDILINIVWKNIPLIVSLDEIKRWIIFYKKNLLTQIKNVSNNEYKFLKDKFKGQKKDARPELKDVDFDDFISDIDNKMQYIMNKYFIKDFIEKFESSYNTSLFDKIEINEEFYSSSLFNLYINSIQAEEDFYITNKELIEKLIQ